MRALMRVCCTIFPQNWTSDNTDACDRVTIQSGFNLLYPQSTMGAHVSITLNHQTGRSTTLDTRYQVCRLYNPLSSCTRFALCGLDPADAATGKVYGGDELMQIGLTVPLVKHDFTTFCFHLVKI